MRFFTPLVVCCAVLLCGCGHARYNHGRGDAGKFLLQRAIAYGGRPITTNGLPNVGADWRYVQDEWGVGVLFPVSQYSEVDAYLRSAFGPPSSHAGWSVRNVGVAIYLQRAGTNTEVSILPAMSDEQQARMWQKIGETVKENTK
jgi:hypothetical protein